MKQKFIFFIFATALVATMLFIAVYSCYLFVAHIKSGNYDINVMFHVVFTGVFLYISFSWFFLSILQEDYKDIWKKKH